ncbi:MAG: hypothetical protein HFH41_06100 [Lachnospiraceae bacterium]|nr:hypothetical protein [Lachnospiraceae bacterium]
MRRTLSMILTFLCTAIILGAGYFVIVGSGKSVLEKERVLEEASYENTSSNIFYGKIEEDIELFPWNYYPEDGKSEIAGTYPRFQYNLFADEIGEAELKAGQNWYLCQLIAFRIGRPIEEIWEFYEKGQKGIMDRMVMVESSSFGSLYFYQDILELGGKQYQVRIACGGWNIISFMCAEYSGEKKRDKKRWEEGKEKLVAVLEDSEEDMREYFDYMNYLNNFEITTVYSEKKGYLNMYLQSFYWLENIMDSESLGDSQKIPQEAVELFQKWGEGESAETKEINIGGKETEEGVSSYSYQIIELKDMILLLMQGEETLGLYYDPVDQCFCGYNYFYEY